MADFSILEPYICNKEDQAQEGSKHMLYRLSLADVTAAEDRLGHRLPEELRHFYLTIGYGFLCCYGVGMFDRVLDPASVADFNLAQGIHQSDPLAHEYALEYKAVRRLAFFEVDETTFLTLALDQETQGTCPVYDGETRIAGSLEEFVRRMDALDDYYLKETLTRHPQEQGQTSPEP